MTTPSHRLRPSGPSRPLLHAAAALLLGALLGACGEEAATPAAEPAPTDDAPQAGATVKGNTLEMTTIAVDGEVEAKPHHIAGVVELADEFASHNGTRTLFVIVKVPNQRPPRAILRVDRPTFPLAFDIGPEHVMLNVDNPADMLVGDFEVYARLDADGSAMGAPGDIESDALTVTSGTAGHVLTLDRQR